MKKHTAAWRLFHIKYAVRVPQIFMYGKPYLEKHGYHISGDVGLDHERLMETTTMRQTVAGLAVLLDDGAPIDIVDMKDSVAIYDDIQQHLRDWEIQVRGAMHPDEVPPIEDFRALEAIAITLHDYAKHYEPNEITGNALRDRLIAMNRRRNPVRTDRYLRQKITNEQGHLKPYTSIVDRIEQALYGGGGWQ